MKNFQFVGARTVEEAVEALATSAGPARPIAGGTDLIVELSEGRRTLDRVVGLDDVAELRRIEFDADGTMRLGAATPCSTIYSNLQVRRAYPILIDSASIIGSVQIQNRASIGGNLCNASPSADSIPSLICLDAQAVIEGPQGSRTVPVDEFCTGPRQTVLAKDELLVDLVIPAAEQHEGGKYLRFIPRNEMDIAVAGAGSLVRIDPDTNTITHARIALAAVAPTPLRVESAEQVLIGREPHSELIAEAAELAAAASKPISDIRGSADYRRHLVKVLVKRTLDEALRQAGASFESNEGGVVVGE